MVEKDDDCMVVAINVSESRGIGPGLTTSTSRGNNSVNKKRTNINENEI